MIEQFALTHHPSPKNRYAALHCGVHMSKSKSLLCTFALTASGLLAQAPGPPILIHLHPVALDASGQPVTDLTAGDFKIVDQGKPETIFAFHKPAVEPAARLGPLERTNRPGGAMQHTIAILFDLMNENQADRLENWHTLSKSLAQLESGNSVYFYLLNLEGELVPIHAIGPPSADDATWPHDVTQVLDKAMKAASHARPVHMGQEDQVKKTFHQLEALAGELAAFPGRRDIIWITDGMQNVYNPKLPCNGDWVECALYVPHLAVTLAHADVAVNPLSYSRDLSTAVNPMMQMDTKSSPINRPANSTDAQSGGLQENAQGSQGADPALDLAQMALLTGGRAYFRQDVRAVLKQVATDDANSFEIAYDPSAANWDNKFHRIRITCERAGVKLQVRERYYALADTRPVAERMKAALMAAYQSPSDAAEIGLLAKIAPMQGDKPGVHLEIRINPSDIMLSQQGGKYTGAVYLLISDRGASGALGEPSLLNFNLELTSAQHDAVMKEGIPLAQDHPTTDAVQQVRIIVLDQSTNAVGSLTIPVK
jgi:VWFA-related protein